MTSRGAKRCPIDGRALPTRATGRPARFCGEGCRRAAGNELRRIDRELARLEAQRNDALVSAAGGDPFGFEDSTWARDRRVEAAALAARIKVGTNRLARLHEQLSGEGSGKRTEPDTEINAQEGLTRRTGT